jgi:hypothetical protein
LSVVCDCLFKIFTAALHIGGQSFIHNLRMHLAVPTRTHLSWMPYLRNKVKQYSLVLVENKGIRRNISEV